MYCVCVAQHSHRFISSTYIFLFVNIHSSFIFTCEMSEKLVIVTGFGPFVGHEKVNASWEAVKQLPDSFVCGEQKFVLKKLEVPVVYADVDGAVDAIWREKPALVIHCGVGNSDNAISLEKYSYNCTFCRPDFKNQYLTCEKAVLKNLDEECKAVDTKLDLAKVISKIMAEDKINTVKISRHPGNYLCCYIYLKSLDVDQERSLFVHVPPIDDSLSLKQITDSVHKVVIRCAEQLLSEGKV